MALYSACSSASWAEWEQTSVILRSASAWRTLFRAFLSGPSLEGLGASVFSTPAGVCFQPSQHSQELLNLDAQDPLSWGRFM